MVAEGPRVHPRVPECPRGSGSKGVTESPRGSLSVPEDLRVSPRIPEDTHIVPAGLRGHPRVTECPRVSGSTATPSHWWAGASRQLATIQFTGNSLTSRICFCQFTAHHPHPSHGLRRVVWWYTLPSDLCCPPERSVGRCRAIWLPCRRSSDSVERCGGHPRVPECHRGSPTRPRASPRISEGRRAFPSIPERLSGRPRVPEGHRRSPRVPEGSRESPRTPNGGRGSPSTP